MVGPGKQALPLPVIKISMPSPQEEPKRRPILVTSETRLGFAERWKRNDVISIKGSRSQGCSPDRQSRLEVRCVSSPHIPAKDKPPLPTHKIKMNFEEHIGEKGRQYLHSHIHPSAISPSRSVPSLNDILPTYNNLDLSASSPACLLRNAKIQADRKKHHHASLESLVDHHQFASGIHHDHLHRKVIGRSMEQFPAPFLGRPPQSSQLNVSLLGPISSSSRSVSLNALSFSSNSDLIHSLNASQGNDPAGVSSQVAPDSSYCSSKLSPQLKKTLGVHANNYMCLSSSTPDLRIADQHRLKPLLVGEFSQYSQ